LNVNNGPYEEINGVHMLSSCFTKINYFKFDLAFYLDSVGTSNEDLNTMANHKLLLDVFTKIYQARNQYPLIIKTSSNGINSYILPSLDYEITDHHLPRGFVTSRKPSTNIFCDYVYCDYTNYTNLNNCSVLACGHGYHNHCLQRCQSKCLICLDNLQVEIKKNVNVLKESMTKRLNENEFIENNENTVDDDSGNVESATDDAATMEILLENAKKHFLSCKFCFY